MTRFKYIIICIITLGISACSLSNNTEILFSETSNNWQQDGNSKWSFTDNILTGIADSTTGFLISTKSYKNFELNLEFNPDNTINSGVFVRCNNQDISATNCYEINVWDLHPNQDNRTGAIVARLKPFEKVKTLNQWNTYKIECKNNTIKAWVNGILTAKLNDQQLTSGKIALQAAGNGTIKFRNVIVTPLD